MRNHDVLPEKVPDTEVVGNDYDLFSRVPKALTLEVVCWPVAKHFEDSYSIFCIFDNLITYASEL